MNRRNRMKGVVLGGLVWLLAIAGVAQAQEVETDAADVEDLTLEVAEEETSIADWFEIGLEYRLRNMRVDPFELSEVSVRDVSWSEQRGRIDMSFNHPSVGSLVLQADILDGVLLGDNGYFGSELSPTSGVTMLVRSPNNVGWEVGLPSEADPLDPDAYIPVFNEIEPIRINRLFAEIRLPFGLLRFGRQPMVEGPYLAVHDGSRSNRWGVSDFSDTSDRILFATKLDQAIGLLVNGEEHEHDFSKDRGVFLAFGLDWLNQGDLTLNNDNTMQVPISVFWKVPEADWLGMDVRDFEIALTAVHVFNEKFQTAIWSLPTRIQGVFGPFAAAIQFSVVLGETREVSEGFAVLTSTDAVIQNVRGLGVNAVFDYTIGPVMLTLEFDYATGDEDPRPGTDLTTYSFSRDLNVGLLLFEHLLAFESARSAAVGIENLASLDADSFPVTEIDTDGRFTNAIAVFPQVLVNVVDTPKHHFHARAGALIAWAEAGVVDPILTVLAEDGNWISDDAVNFHGGDPGDFYGTEFDLQLQYAFQEVFFWTIEGAVLLPGNALEDEHGHAVNAFLVENRLELVF